MKVFKTDNVCTFLCLAAHVNNEDKLHQDNLPTPEYEFFFLSISCEFYQQMKSSPNWSKFLLSSCLTSPRIIVVPKLGFHWNHLGRFKIHWPLPSWGFDVIGLRCIPSDSIEQPKLSSTARLTSSPHGCFQITGHNRSSCWECLLHSRLPHALSYAQYMGFHMFAKWTWPKQGLQIPRLIQFLWKPAVFWKTLWVVVVGFCCCHNELPPI